MRIFRPLKESDFRAMYRRMTDDGSKGVYRFPGCYIPVREDTPTMGGNEVCVGMLSWGSDKAYELKRHDGHVYGVPIGIPFEFGD